jgi:hypothetical protein
MRWLNSTSKWSTTIIVVFFVSWFWTEIAEYITRDTFREEVTEFMASDTQFNKKDGEHVLRIIAAMNRRMEADEKRIAVLEQHVMGEAGQHK